LDKICDLFKPREIIFTGPGKTMFELERAIDTGIRLINLESVVEAKRISSIARKRGSGPVDVLVRINTDYCIHDALENMSGKPTHMGIDQQEIVESLQHIMGLGNLNIRGYHIFSASGILDHKKILDYVDYVFSLTRETDKRTGLETRILDFGGGFGIDYTEKDLRFDVAGFFQGLQSHVRKYGFQDKELVLELGRFVVAESGYYVSEIIDIKDTKGKKHIVTAGGTNHMRLPLATGVNQPTYVINRNRPVVISGQTSVCDEVVDVCGPLCYAEDKTAMDIRIKSAEIGDLVVIAKSGAYGYNVSAVNFLSHMPAPEYAIDCSR
jgi:diaminopimelate decarboxylase